MTHTEPAKLPCPMCGSQDSRTLKTKWFPQVQATWRRRLCGACGARFSTHETYLLDEPAVRVRAGALSRPT